MLSLGWYGKFALPVDAATSIIATIVKSGAVKVESAHIDGLSSSFLVPTKMEYDLQPLDAKFLSDCPMDKPKKDEYFAWLKTKANVIEGYEPESYATFLKVKDQS